MNKNLCVPTLSIVYIDSLLKINSTLLYKLMKTEPQELWIYYDSFDNDKKNFKEKKKMIFTVKGKRL